MTKATATTFEDYRQAEEGVAAGLGIALEQRFVSLDGPVSRARVIETGAGDPVLFVHGGGGMASQWLALMAAVSDRRCIAVDRPGCGGTDTFDYTKAPSVRDHAVTFLDGVLDGLGLESVDVVGNSMGGLFSLWLALDRPERVRSLVLLGCPALVVGTGAPMPMRLLSRRAFGWVLERPMDVKGMHRVMKMMGHDDSLADRLPAGFMEMAVAGGNLPGAGASFRSLLARVLRLSGPQPDCVLDEAELRELRVNPAVGWGAADPFGDLDAARRFCAATGGELTVVGHGHLPWLDDNTAVAEIIAKHLASTAATT